MTNWPASLYPVNQFTLRPWNNLNVGLEESFSSSLALREKTGVAHVEYTQTAQVELQARTNSYPHLAVPVSLPRLQLADVHEPVVPSRHDGNAVPQPRAARSGAVRRDRPEGDVANLAGS